MREEDMTTNPAPRRKTRYLYADNTVGLLLLWSRIRDRPRLRALGRLLVPVYILGMAVLTVVAVARDTSPFFTLNPYLGVGISVAVAAVIAALAAYPHPYNHLDGVVSGPEEWARFIDCDNPARHPGLADWAATRYQLIQVRRQINDITQLDDPTLDPHLTQLETDAATLEIALANHERTVNRALAADIRDGGTWTA